MIAARFMLILPLVAMAAPRSHTRRLSVRHGDDEEGEMDMDMDMSSHDHDLDHDHDHNHPHSSAHSTSNSSPLPTNTKASIADSAAHAASHHHSHGAHADPKIILNDSEIHYWHSFPPTYLAADFRLDRDTAIFGEEFNDEWDDQQAEIKGEGKWSGKRAWMIVHVVGMCMGYFGALPISLALRAANHPSHYLANIVFLGITLLGWSAGAWYKAATPDRYEGESHSGLGNMLVLLSLGLSLLDSLGLLKRTADWYRHSAKSQRTWQSYIQLVVSNMKEPEYLSISSQGIHESHPDTRTRQVVFAIQDEDDLSEDDQPHRASQPARPDRFSTYRFSTGSAGSDHTLRDSPSSSSPPAGYPFPKSANAHLRMGAYDESPQHVQEAFIPDGQISPLRLEDRGSSEDVIEPRGKMDAQRIGEICLTWIRRSQVVVAYVSVLSGIAIYTGMCRASFLPSCLAHYIKGSIFFGYGVLTFARYLGAYADMGWAWNMAPAGFTGPTAEMVECAVIFTYGITNTWMERFGAKAGDPYSVKQVQHISIAVMFWFAGLSGMLLESKTLRRILGSSVTSKSQHSLPPSYSFSFNPLPALVIAVTGLAMAAHHQDYLFQIQIHSLWGILLAGGSLFRMLTYIFLWLRPPTESVLPSRPPTEILTAFGWATGGIVFILSSEEVMYGAMRAGYDDMMAFLNITVALTALVFCWEVVVMGVKGYAVTRLGNIGRKGEVEL